MIFKRKKTLKHIVVVTMAMTLLMGISISASADTFSYSATYNSTKNRVDFIGYNNSGSQRYCINSVITYKKVTAEKYNTKTQSDKVNSNSSLTCRTPYAPKNYWFGGTCSFYKSNAPASGVAWTGTASY